jgi:hypothetical protein
MAVCMSICMSLRSNYSVEGDDAVRDSVVIDSVVRDIVVRDSVVRDSVVRDIALRDSVVPICISLQKFSQMLDVQAATLRISPRHEARNRRESHEVVRHDWDEGLFTNSIYLDCSSC